MHRAPSLDTTRSSASPTGADARTTPPDTTVAFVRWPSERELRSRLAETGAPRLLLVEPGAVPPDCWEVEEDWIRTPADPVDLHQRAEVLRRRCAPAPSVRLDEDGLLWQGDRWVALSPIEAALVGELVGRFGRVVARRSLEHAAWPRGGVDARMLDRALSRCRAKLAVVDLEVHRVPGTGYLLAPVRPGGA